MEPHLWVDSLLRSQLLLQFLCLGSVLEGTRMYETPQDLPLQGSLPKQASHIGVFDSPFRRRSHGMGVLKCRSFSLAPGRVVGSSGLG